MSSESVTTESSRLRQFGLYRTIDSRTEEFLKLSRRRQIRQGCACAAVSTVITVTVVVVVLLIYEYGFRVDYEVAPKTKHKQNWMSMLNDSDAGFDKTHHKANFNIERNALKLLPLILKAIKQNKYLEKVIDDSSQPPNNERHTTEFPIQRNVFTDARNWIRMPPSRMYAIEYKTSPIVFFKSRNLETFAKARKMMESQRIMNYLDKMLSEKVNSVSPNEVKNGESSSTIKTTTISDEIPAKTYLQYINTDRVSEIIAPTWKIEPPVTERKETDSCKCPGNLGEILKKLARNIEQLLPDGSERKVDVSKPCRKSKTTTANPSIVTTKRFPKIINKSGKKIEATVNEYRNQHKSSIIEPKLEFRPEEKLISAQNMIANIPNLQRREPHKDLSDIVIANYKKKHSDCKESDCDQTTTIKWNIEPTEYITFNSITTSKPMTSKSHWTFRSVTSKSSSYKSTTSTTLKPMTEMKMKTTTKFWRVTTEENVFIAHQFNENIFSGVKDYSKQSKLAQLATTNNSAVFIDSTVDEIKSKSKKMTLKQFLQNQKESLSKSKPLKGTLSDVYKAEISEVPAIKTFNTKRDHNQEQKGSHPKIDSNTTHTLLNNEISNMQVENNTKARSVESIMAFTDEDFDNILPELIETDTILLNDTALAESLRKLGITSKEVSHSILPQSRPSFLEIRRNEGRHEDADYDLDTLNNLNVYD